MTVDPHGLLREVEPDLASVVLASAQAPQPFEVTYGLRTPEAEKIAVATGHSQTLHSRHLPDQAGLAAAVDLTPIIDGALSFAPGREAIVYGQIARQVLAAAEALGIDVEWGGDWADFKDWGHFQLPWSQYP